MRKTGSWKIVVGFLTGLAAGILVGTFLEKRDHECPIHPVPFANEPIPDAPKVGTKKKLTSHASHEKQIIRYRSACLMTIGVADAYWKKGEFDKAATWYESAVNICKRCLRGRVGKIVDGNYEFTKKSVLAYAWGTLGMYHYKNKDYNMAYQMYFRSFMSYPSESAMNSIVKLSGQSGIDHKKISEIYLEMAP